MESKCVCVFVCVDGLGVEGSEWLAEEREGRLEQVDSGTESADDRCANITSEVMSTQSCCHFMPYWTLLFLMASSLFFGPSEKMTRAIAQETQQLETDLNEERSRYQNLLTEHLRLEEKYDDLKEEMASSVRDRH